MVESTLLPIGTIVKLNKIKKTVMIYGRHQIQTSSNKIYDYIAVPYPEGNLTNDFNVFFNREQIEDIIFKGYESETELALREKIDNDLIASRKKGEYHED